MTTHIVLLRGVNLGSHNRVAMPELRELLSTAGFHDVRTYVASGNVVLEDDAPPEQVARRCGDLIRERFGFDVPVITRTREELAEVIRRDPLGAVAVDPKRYLVTFANAEPASAALEKLKGLAAESERLVVSGREAYSWHPAGVGRSKLWAAMAGGGLGVTATARNWTTVGALLELAGGG